MKCSADPTACIARESSSKGSSLSRFWEFTETREGFSKIECSKCSQERIRTGGYRIPIEA